MGKKKSNKIPETEEQRQLATIAAERYDRYQKVFRPVRDKVIARSVNELGMTEDSGGVNVANQFAFDRAGKDIESSLRDRGLARGGAARVVGMQTAGIDRARSLGTGLVADRAARKSLGISNIKSLIAQGQGQAAESLGGLQQVANLANRQAQIDAEASAAARRAVRSAVGSAAGFAYGQYDGGGRDFSSLRDRTTQSNIQFGVD